MHAGGGGAANEGAAAHHKRGPHPLAGGGAHVRGEGAAGAQVERERRAQQPAQHDEARDGEGDGYEDLGYIDGADVPVSPTNPSVSDDDELSPTEEIVRSEIDCWKMKNPEATTHKFAYYADSSAQRNLQFHYYKQFVYTEEEDNNKDNESPCRTGGGGGTCSQSEFIATFRQLAETGTPYGLKKSRGLPRRKMLYSDALM